MSQFADFHFLRPEWFLLLVPLVFFLLRRPGFSLQQNAWKNAVDPHLLQHLMDSQTSASKSTVFYVFTVAAVALIVSLAGPSWQKLPQPVLKTQDARVFVLDLSQSMESSDISPTRLTRARLKLMDMLRQSKEGQTGLVVFAAAAYVVSPLTDDAKTIMNLVPTLSTSLVPVQGSRASLGILKAKELLVQAGVGQGEVILLSDGVDENAQDAAASLYGAGFTLSVLAVGTEEGAPIQTAKGGFVKDQSGDIVLPGLQFDELAQLAITGGGVAVRLVTDDKDTKTLMADKTTLGLDSEFSKSDRQLDLWLDQGPWFLLATLPFALLLFRKGMLLIAAFLVLPLFPQPSWALGWDELWSSADQRGAVLQEKGKYKDAARTYRDEKWQADAWYRAGEYEKAAKIYKQFDDADSQYNYANSLAKSGKLEEALAKYDELLKEKPLHSDAKANRDLVKKLLDQQEQQKQENDQQQQQDGEQNQDQGSPDSSENNEAGESQSDKSESGQDENDSRSQAKDKQNQSEQQQQDGKAQQKQDEQERRDEEASGSGEKQEEGQMERQDEQELTQEQKERLQAMEQWLRRIPDDPGGLLRQKFLLQHRQQQQTEDAGNPW